MSSNDKQREQSGSRMPVIYLPHGGGPWPWVPGMRAMHATLAAYTEVLLSSLKEAPRAVLMVSAHWEESVATVQASATPPMLYDYSGFPPETYKVRWPAPGAPEFASEIERLLCVAGIACQSSPDRGFDHGTFVPMAIADPKATMPTLQLSLVAGLDPAFHIQLGQALQPLRDQGVLIVGSGMSFHNMRALQGFLAGGGGPNKESMAFDQWLVEAMSDAATRQAKLVDWEQAPQARYCHPREEHLIPLHVCAGAAGDDLASFPYREVLLGAHVSAVHFGSR